MRPFFTNMVKVFRLVWEASGTYTLALSLLTLLQGLFPVSMAWVGKLIMDNIILAIESADAHFDISGVMLLVGLELTLAILSSLLRYSSDWVRERLTDLLAHHIDMLIIEKAASLDLAFYENPAFYDKMRNAEAEARHRPVALLSETFRLIQSLISLSPFMVLLFNFNWVVALLLTATTLPYVVVQSSNARFRYILMRDRAPEGRQLSYLRHLLTSDYSAKEVKLFNLSEYLIRKYVQVFAKFYRENMGLSSRKNLSGFLLEVISSLGMFGSYAYIVYQTILRYITIGDLTLYFQALTQSQGYALSVLASISTIWEHNLFVSNLFDFLALEPLITTSAQSIKLPAPMRDGVEFRNVSFKYPETDRFALQDINIRIRPAETIALVGENGSGKTTLVKLLTRLYDPTEGEILIDGVDIRQIDLCELRQQIGVIFQDYARYNMRAGENIGFGKIEELNNLERIVHAARQSHAHEVVDVLPQGYATMLGKWFEGGHQLSEGEWQKIALARALMRDNTQILILDEPTASLDARTEYEIFKEFSRMAKGKITILVSHRLSTVRVADRILVLNSGRIVEQGTHEELLAINGKYAQLFNMQAEKYR